MVKLALVLAMIRGTNAGLEEHDSGWELGWFTLGYTFVIVVLA